MPRIRVFIGICLLAAAAAASGDAASSSAISASLEAYVASVTAGSAYNALWTGLPKGIPQDIALLAQYAPMVSSFETQLQPSQQSFINSVISKEQRIEHSTVDPAQFATSESAASVSQAALASSINAYLASLTTEQAYASVSSEIPPRVLQELPLFYDFAPAILVGEGGLPTAAQSFISSVISVEQEIAHTTVETVVLNHAFLPFSTTTLTGGTFARPSATAAPGTTATSSTAGSATSTPSSAAGIRCGRHPRHQARIAIGIGAAAALWLI